MTEQIQTLYGRLECICRDLKVLCNVFSIGSFSNVDGDGDGKEDVKKAIGLLRKKTLCTYITLFCSFLYRPCTTSTRKCLNASFVGPTDDESLFLYRNLSVVLLRTTLKLKEINPREIRLHLPFSANWNKRDKD